MENETIDNSIDFTTLIEEIQILNQGIVSNGERLDQINEYLILKDKEEKKEKQAAEKQAAEDYHRHQEKQNTLPYPIPMLDIYNICDLPILSRLLLLLIQYLLKTYLFNPF